MSKRFSLSLLAVILSATTLQQPTQGFSSAVAAHSLIHRVAVVSSVLSHKPFQKSDSHHSEKLVHARPLRRRRSEVTLARNLSPANLPNPPLGESRIHPERNPLMFLREPDPLVHPPA